MKIRLLQKELGTKNFKKNSLRIFLILINFFLLFKITRYEAGDGVCSSGTWEAYFKDAPVNSLLELKFRCVEDLEVPNPVPVVRQEKRKNSLVNDDQCNVVYESMQFLGTWGNKPITLNWLEGCQDGLRAEISMDYDDRIVYVDGTVFEEGRLVKGRWYGQERGTTENTNGPYLFFPLTDEKAIHFFWSGQTILSSDLDKPENHRVETPLAYRGPENNKCRRYNLNDGLITVNSAAPLTAGLLFVALLFCLF